nr:Immediate-early protein 2 [Human betaherpesvirus 6A]AVI08144.1 Immediate-early protein 2 [Human betaherpesvirus 6A]
MSSDYESNRHADVFRNSPEAGEKFPLHNSSPFNTHEQSNHSENAIDEEQKKAPNITTSHLHQKQNVKLHNTKKCKKKRPRDDDSDSSIKNFCKKRISGAQKTESEVSEIDDLCYRDYVRLKERKVSEKFKIHRGRVATKDFQKLFRNTMRAFEYKQIPKKPCNDKNLKEAVYNICCNGLSNNAAIIMYFTRSKKVAQNIKIMQKELMIRPNITVSEAFKMNHAPPKYYDKDEIKRFIQLQKQGPQELWDKFENNTTHDLFTRHSDVKTMIIYAATPIDFVGAVKTCNKYAKDNPKEIVLRVCSIIDGDNPISIYNPISKDFKSKFSTLSKC